MVPIRTPAILTRKFYLLADQYCPPVIHSSVKSTGATRFDLKKERIEFSVSWTSIPQAPCETFTNAFPLQGQILLA
jgi:hypothetical protein